MIIDFQHSPFPSIWKGMLLAYYSQGQPHGEEVVAAIEQALSGEEKHEYRLLLPANMTHDVVFPLLSCFFSFQITSEII
jgi:hypothetical protein